MGDRRRVRGMQALVMGSGCSICGAVVCDHWLAIKEDCPFIIDKGILELVRKGEWDIVKELLEVALRRWDAAQDRYRSEADADGEIVPFLMMEDGEDLIANEVYEGLGGRKDANGEPPTIKDLVIRVHEAVLVKTGGGAEGIRYDGWLDEISSLREAARVVLVNHPFWDGNKRTAYVVLKMHHLGDRHGSLMDKIINDDREWLIMLNELSRSEDASRSDTVQE